MPILFVILLDFDYFFSYPTKLFMISYVLKFYKKGIKAQNNDWVLYCLKKQVTVASK